MRWISPTLISKDGEYHVTVYSQHQKKNIPRIAIYERGHWLVRDRFGSEDIVAVLDTDIDPRVSMLGLIDKLRSSNPYNKEQEDDPNFIPWHQEKAWSECCRTFVKMFRRNESDLDLVTMSESECIKSIAEHLGIGTIHSHDRRKMLSLILFKLSSENPTSPYFMNKFFVNHD